MEDCQVTCNAAFHELFEHNVCRSNSHLRAATTRVVYFDRDTGTRNFRRPELKTCQGVTRNLRYLHYLLENLDHLVFNRFWFHSTCRERQSTNGKVSPSGSGRQHHDIP
jgi:hypothetical protein